MNNHTPYNPEYYYLNQPAKHCPTCKCQEHQNFFQWRNQRVQRPQPNLRVSQFAHSRVLPAADPAYYEVGNHIIPNRTVWFKSVSPRPSRITIRVSSPDRPNLRPSQVSTSLHKRAPSEQTSLGKPFQVSRVSIPETNTMTPIRQFGQKTLTDINDQSTLYSPPQTQRKTVDNTKASIVQQV